MTGTIAEVAFPADRFALGHTLAELDSVRFDVEQVAAYNRNHLMPFVWVGTDSQQAIETAFSADETRPRFSTRRGVRHGMSVSAGVGQGYRRTDSDTRRGKRDGAGRDGERKTSGSSGCCSATTTPSLAPTSTVVGEESTSNSRTSTSSPRGERADTASHRANNRRSCSRTRTGTTRFREARPRRTSPKALGVTHQSISEKLRRGHANLLKNTLALNQ